MEKEEKEKEEEKGIKQDEPESRINRRDTGSWGTEEAGDEERAGVAGEAGEAYEAVEGEGAKDARSVGEEGWK